MLEDISFGLSMINLVPFEQISLFEYFHRIYLSWTTGCSSEICSWLLLNEKHLAEGTASNDLQNLEIILVYLAIDEGLFEVGGVHGGDGSRLE